MPAAGSHLVKLHSTGILRPLRHEDFDKVLGADVLLHVQLPNLQVEDIDDGVNS